MMLITVNIQGESDTKPFTKVFEYATKSDERIFFESVKLIEERIAKGLKININETLVLFVNLIITDLIAGKTINEIQKSASEFLSPEKVLIGVAESLQNLTFTITLDDLPKQEIVLNSPIPIYTYVMSDKT